MKTTVLDSYALLAYFEREVVTDDPEFEAVIDQVDVRWLTSG